MDVPETGAGGGKLFKRDVLRLTHHDVSHPHTIVIRRPAQAFGVVLLAVTALLVVPPVLFPPIFPLAVHNARAADGDVLLPVAIEDAWIPVEFNTCGAGGDDGNL